MAAQSEIFDDLEPKPHIKSCLFILEMVARMELSNLSDETARRREACLKGSPGPAPDDLPRPIRIKLIIKVDQTPFQPLPCLSGSASTNEGDSGWLAALSWWVA
jgi:hypothetical protein